MSRRTARLLAMLAAGAVDALLWLLLIAVSLHFGALVAEALRA